MKTCKTGLALVLCVFVLMGCKKKDTAPEPTAPDAAVTDAESKPAVEGADVSSPQEGTEAAWTGKGVIHFRGKVDEWIDPFGPRACKAIQVSADPHFLMRTTIESVEEKDAPIQAGQTVVFAIHSPSKMFYGSHWEIIKGTYSFQVTVEKTAEGKLWYHGLQVVPKWAKPAKAP